MNSRGNDSVISRYRTNPVRTGGLGFLNCRLTPRSFPFEPISYPDVNASIYPGYAYPGKNLDTEFGGMDENGNFGKAFCLRALVGEHPSFLWY